MKIAYCSDLHLDFGIDTFLEEGTLSQKMCAEADVLILAGDIAEVKNYIKSERSSKYDLSNQIQMFFKECAKYYDNVLYVFGNHEHYNGHIVEDYNKVADLNLPKNFRVLNNSSVVIDDVVFYGGTMWTNFYNGKKSAMYYVGQGMNDFKRIRARGYSKFTTQDALNEHLRYTAKLKETLLNETRKQVVISHHAPSFKSIPDQYKDSVLSPGYASDLENLINDMNIDLWVHGHVHEKFDYTIGNTNIVCRPSGYGHFEKELFNNFSVAVKEI